MADRITIASMATEMGGIILLFSPNQAVLDFCREASGHDWEPMAADADAEYVETIEVDWREAAGPLRDRDFFSIIA